MDNKYKQIIEKYIEAGPKEPDLTDEEYNKQVILAAEELLNAGIALEQISGIEEGLLTQYDASMIFVLLVLKITRSRLLVETIQSPLRVSVVFAVYKEHNRIRKKSEHPHGENFLVRKVAQLQWLFKGLSNIQWQLILVDDGCPEGSGKIAREIVGKEDLQEEVSVLFLEEAIERGLLPVRSLNSTSESQKGGSIVYGMWQAVEDYGKEHHIVAFTDADLSTHLGQTGLLIDPIIKRNKLAAIGSRREKDSVVIKKGARNTRGKLFIYLWKRLIPNLGYVVDTQCGFKAFKAEIIPVIGEELIEKKFAFDIELLLRTALLEPDGIEKVGIAWIDSEAASTTTALSPYLPMLKSIVKMYRKYFEPSDEREEFASFIEGLDEESFHLLLDHIPQELLDREPIEYNEFDKVSVADLRSAIDQ